MNDYLYRDVWHHERRQGWRSRWQWAKLWIIYPGASVALVVLGYCLGRL